MRGRRTASALARMTSSVKLSVCKRCKPLQLHRAAAAAAAAAPPGRVDVLHSAVGWCAVRFSSVSLSV